MPTLRHTTRRALAAVSVLGLVSSLGACATSSDTTGTNGYITGTGVVTTISAANRKDVPVLSGDALQGGSIDVSDYRGQIVVVNVWASWCPPCRAEAADLVAAYEKLPEVAFVGLDTSEDSKSAAEAFVREQEIPYASLYDEDGSLLLAFYGMLRPDSLPSTIVIDTEGRIAALVLGPVTTSTLVGLVDDVEREA